MFLQQLVEYEKKLRLLYFQLKYMDTLTKTIQNLFSCFPCFLSVDSMFFVDRGRTLSSIGKMLYKEITLLLDQFAKKPSESDMISLAEKLVSRSYQLDSLLVKVVHCSGHLYRVISDMAMSVDVALITEKLPELKEKFYDAMRVFAGVRDQVAGIKRSIRETGDITEEIRTLFEDNLEALAGKLSAWHSDFYTLLEKQEKTSAYWQDKKAYQQALAELKKLSESAVLFGGPFYHQILQQQPILLLLFCKEFLEESSIVPMLSRMTTLYDNYFNLIFNQSEKIVKNFSGEKFSQLMQIWRQFVCQEGWMQTLTQGEQKITDKHSKGSFLFVLQIKRLVFNLKRQYRLDFYEKNQPQDKKLIIQLANNIVKLKQELHDLNAIVLIQRLNAEIQKLNLAIGEKETGLKRYGWLVGGMTAVARLWTEGFYFRWPESLLTVSEAVIDSSALANISIFNEKLTPEYRAFFTHLTGTAFLSIDLLSSQYFGISYTFLNVFIQSFLADLDTIIQLCEKVGISEKQVIIHEPKLEWLLGLCLHVGFSSMISGANSGSLGLLSLGYVAATTCRSYVGKLYHHFLGAPSSIAQHVCQNVIQYGAYIAGSRFCYKIFPSVYSFFSKSTPSGKPTPNELIENVELCQQYSDDCLSAIRKISGAKIEASVQDIYKLLNSQRKKWHPDWRQWAPKEVTDLSKEEANAQFSRIMQARECIKSLKQ